MLTDEIAIANAEYIAYSSPLDNVISNEDYISGMLEWNENAIDILYPVDLDIKTSFYENLGADTLILQNSLWETLKIENSVEPWVYITSSTIVLMLLGLFLYSYIIKKIRDKY